MTQATEKLAAMLHGALGRLPAPVRRRLEQRYFRLTRAVTLGVRALVLDEAGRVLLVRHTYKPGWTFPGGGVEKGETAQQTLAHELRDEAAIHLRTAPRPFAIYANHAIFPDDHVLLYVLHPADYERHPWRPNAEIAEMDFFSPGRLPDGTTPGTRRRLAEVLEGKPPSPHW